MPRTHLIVVRHGESAWNVEGRYQGQLDSALTDNGLRQSRELAARLAREKLSALHSSDLGRAMQTAEIIAKYTSLAIVTCSGLRERHLGIFQGLLKREIQQRFPDEYRSFKGTDPDYVIREGESAAQAATRIISALESIAQQHAGQRIVVVTHGGVASALVRHTLGIPLGAPRRFERPNASYNAFWYEDGKWFLETWGDVSHLVKE